MTSSSRTTDADATIELNHGHSPEHPMAWRLLTRLNATARAVEEVAYNMRIITHLLANSDLRHLSAYADDMDAAVASLGPVDAELRVATEDAIAMWGLPPGSALSTIVGHAPESMHAPLKAALAELTEVTRELQSDGEVAEGVLEQATRLVQRRITELGRTGADATYRSRVAAANPSGPS